MSELPYDWNKALAVDFDGTITHDNNYPEKPEKPNERIVKALQYAKKIGYYIIIHSCRMTPPNDTEEQRELIFNFCIENDVPFDVIWDTPGKPIAFIYIDDRAMEPYYFAFCMLDGWLDKKRGGR